MSKFQIVFQDVTADDRDLIMTAFLNGTDKEIKITPDTDLIEIDGMSVTQFSAALKKAVTPHNMDTFEEVAARMPGANLTLYTPTTKFHVFKNNI